MKAEYTIASTSEMLDARKRDWSDKLLGLAGIPREKLCDITMPGSKCGLLSDEICHELGAPKATVMCTASHDTASAVAAIPTQEKDFIFISCGTWSLLGTELGEPCLNAKAREYNFTNEGGVNDKYCFMQNIMGTWLIQESRRQWIREGEEYGFGELESEAAKAEASVALWTWTTKRLSSPETCRAGYARTAGRPDSLSRRQKARSSGVLTKVLQ